MPPSINQLHIKWLPVNLRKKIADAFGTERRTIGAVVTWVRHNMTNYDSLCITHVMTAAEHAIFQEEVNKKVRRALRAWHATAVRNGTRGLKGVEHFEDIYRDEF